MSYVFTDNTILPVLASTKHTKCDTEVLRNSQLYLWDPQDIFPPRNPPELMVQKSIWWLFKATEIKKNLVKNKILKTCQTIPLSFIARWDVVYEEIHTDGGGFSV